MALHLYGRIGPQHRAATRQRHGPGGNARGAVQREQRIERDLRHRLVGPLPQREQTPLENRPGSLPCRIWRSATKGHTGRVVLDRHGGQMPETRLVSPWIDEDGSAPRVVRERIDDP